MSKPELIFISGCNAAGKSSFIRTRINELQGYDVIMTDAYKGRTKEIVTNLIAKGNNIILETVFNDESFKDIADKAKNAGYHTSLVVLFLDTIQQSIERAAFRNIKQSGLDISSGNIRINFNESFKNIARYFFYFDQSDFIYTGVTGKNTLIMGFNRSELTFYKASQLQYPQKFAAYSFQNQRLDQSAYDIITANSDYNVS